LTASASATTPLQFEGRLAGLLGAFRKLKLPAKVTDRFHVMGGECNYLLRVTPEDKRLEFVPDLVRVMRVRAVFGYEGV
jgi:IMP and pyridine-specific 5'-nucleotidase